MTTSKTPPKSGSPDASPKKKRTNGRGMKAKGDAFEREVAAHLSLHCGVPISRAPLSGGGFVGMTGRADLIGTPHLFCEVKRVEKLSFPAALAQAEANIAKTHSPDMPVVINRRSRMAVGQSYTLLRLDDFIRLYHAFLKLHGYTT